MRYLAGYDGVVDVANTTMGFVYGEGRTRVFDALSQCTIDMYCRSSLFMKAPRRPDHAVDAAHRLQHRSKEARGSHLVVERGARARLSTQADWVLCLAVAEHVPQRAERVRRIAWSRLPMNSIRLS